MPWDTTIIDDGHAPAGDGWEPIALARDGRVLWRRPVAVSSLTPWKVPETIAEARARKIAEVEAAAKEG